MSSGITQRSFGEISSGEPVAAYTLRGRGGLSLQAITYGGIVTHLYVPDRHGELADVVLGFDDFDDYLKPHPCFGAIVGRVAGRMTGGRFALDGQTYALARNNGANHLHGGVHGFDKQLWNAMPEVQSQDGVSLRLSRISPEGEEGYPGNLAVSVTYTVTDDNRFIIDVEATTDTATPISLTHHGYFNLAGHDSGSIDQHELQINADFIARVDGRFTLVGTKKSVDGDPADLRCAKRLGEVIPALQDQHGDLYFVNRPLAQALVSAATLIEPRSGRVMTVRTSEACVQLYTAVHLDGTLKGKSGKRYGSFAGLCLECEGYPDGANVPSMGDIVLRPGQTLRQTTEYAFSTL